MSADNIERTDSTTPRRVISLRWVFTLATTALVVAAVLGVGSMAQRHLRKSLHREVETRLVLEAQNLAHASADALLDDFPELTLMPVVQQMQADRPELAFVVVLDHAGLVQGHADPRRHGTVFEEPVDLIPDADAEVTHPDVAVNGNAELIVAEVVVRRQDGQDLGTVQVGLHRSYVDGVVAESRRALVLVSTFLLVAGVLGAVALMHTLLRPVGALRDGMDRIGRGDLDTPMHLRDRTELGMLADTVNEMAASIKASQAVMLEKNRLDHEMDLAHTIQASLMPDTQVACGRFVAEGSYQAATEVGGDYFDAFELSDDRLGVFMADVAGKGLGGCLVTSMLAALVKARRDHFDSPAALLTALDRDLADTLAPGVFVTAIYGILDTRKGRLTFASAAHCPLLLARPAMGVVEEHRTEGVPLGIMPHNVLASSLIDTTLLLGPGDLALLYTDGLTEAPQGGDGEEYGQARVESILKNSSGSEHGSVLQTLATAVGDWQGTAPRSDDLTLLVLGCPSHMSDAGAEPAEENKIDELLASLRSEEDLAMLIAGADHLEVAAQNDGDRRIGPWIAERFGTGQDESSSHLLELTLTEHVNNVFEHGYLGRPAARADLWHWPADDDSPLAGWILIRDHGRSCPPESVAEPDLDDTEVRRRGRGLGWSLIRTLSKDLVYKTLLNVGNVCAIKPTTGSTTNRKDPEHV